MNMNEAKISFGVGIDKNLVKKLDNIVEESGYLNVGGSEVVERALTSYFKSNLKHVEKEKELIILERKGKL